MKARVPNMDSPRNISITKKKYYEERKIREWISMNEYDTRRKVDEEWEATNRD